MASGKRDAEAAELAGVCRETVTRWRNHSSEFIAALNERRRELWHSSADSIRSLLPKALGVIGHALESQDERIRTTAAFKLMSIIGPLPIKPEASTGMDSMYVELVNNPATVTMMTGK